MGYKGPNEITEDVLEWACNLIFVVQILDSKDQSVTRGMTYNLAVLNSPVQVTLGKG